MQNEPYINLFINVMQSYGLVLSHPYPPPTEYPTFNKKDSKE